MANLEELRHHAAEKLDALVNTNAADPPDSTSLHETLAVLDALEDYFIACATNPHPRPDPPPPGPRPGLTAIARGDLEGGPNTD